jgi:hypothetical protein
MEVGEMRICALGLFLVLTLSVTAFAVGEPTAYGDSYLLVDPSTGALAAHASTVFYDRGLYGEFSASVFTALSNGPSAYAMNNCGDGCAVADAYSQVGQLGLRYYENSSHAANAFADEGFPYFYNAATYDSHDVPPPPAIQLYQIDARNPNAVIWSYTVTGAPLFVSYLQLGSNLVINTATQPSFTLNQANYPLGNNLANMVGSLYGITVQGPTCYVNRSDNVSVNGRYTGLRLAGGDEVAPQYISVTHIGADNLTHVEYCVSPRPESLTTRLTNASGSIDTSANTGFADHDIFLIAETNHYANNNDPMGPVQGDTQPPQSATFQTKAIYYNPFEKWIAANGTASVCNDILMISAPGGDFVTNPLGCITLYLP